jgi:AcrR family transcriptional regulator
VTEERRQRVGAQQRRADILAAALAEFSHKGLHGGSTVTIAREADISHPNLFRLFSTKKELFQAVLVQVFETIGREMLQRGAAAQADPIPEMQDAWDSLMGHRELMMMLLQGYASCNDPGIRDLMHRATHDIFERVAAMPGIEPTKAHRFVAEGTLRMVAAAMDLPARAADDPWVTRFLAK